MQNLELKVPPALITCLCMLLCYACSRYLPVLPLPELVSGLHHYIGGFAILIILAGIWQFSRANTTVDPTAPEKASQLVSSGIYRLTRNPMYLGMLFMVAASVSKFGSVYGLVALPVFVIYLTHFQIKPEERAIEGIFGDEYRHYKKRVRRWL